MMRNFANGSGLRISHPEEKLFPTGGFHFIRTSEGVFSFYPEYLSLITAPFYKISGERGTLFFPLCATLLLLFMAWRYWHVPPLLLLLTTPLFFYSLLLWEMTASICMVTAALLLVQKKYCFSAGAVLGCSLLMREEAYFVCAALGAALLLSGRWKEMLRLGAGFLIPALGIWLYQWCVHGHFLGNHGKYYYLNNNAGFSIFTQLKTAFFNYYHHLLRFDGWGSSKLGYLVWFVLFPVIAGAAPGFKKWRALKYAACAVYLTAATLLSAGIWFQKNTIYSASMLTGILTATPVILGFLVSWHGFLRCRKFRTEALFILVYLLCVPPLMTASDIGLVWGARHFLVLLPLLVYLSFQGFRFLGVPRFRLEKISRFHLIPLWAAALSIFIQSFGLFALYRVSGDSYAIEQKILSSPEKVIVTDVFYIPEQMPRLFFEKKVLQVITKEDLEHLGNALRSGKHKGFLLLLSPRFRRMNDAVLKELLTRFPLTAAPAKLTGKGGFPDLFAGKCRAAFRE